MAMYGCGHKHEGHDHKGHDHDHTHAHKHEEHAHTHDHAGHDHSEHDHETAEHNEDEIIFTKAQAARTEFEVKEIQPSSFQQVIKTTGQILPAPGDETVIVAVSNGVVSYANRNLAAGSATRQSEALFYINSKNLNDGDYYTRVRANYEKSKTEYERAKELVKDKIVSQKELESARLDYENAKTAYEAVAGKQSGKGITVTAPMKGYIKNIAVKDGEYVTAGQTIATVSQNKRLMLQAEVSEKYYSSLNGIASANFKTPYDNHVYTLK
ncbi:MAG: efflux RND transporter periplasmic adaptor subunit, partial [Odoribacter sp.]|nr:efflux RND transporter periplasmic adaptor subunit [Odoribacter sp.]